MPVPRSDPSARLPPGARRTAMLAVLRDHEEGLQVAELADRVGLHANTVRAHLDVLVRTGLVARADRSRGGRGRPREVYVATGAPEGDRRYEMLARMLAGRLAEISADPAADAVAAGRTWAAPEVRADHDPAGTAATPPTPGTTAPTPSPTSAGGDVREAVAPVMRLLRETGFAPELDETTATIRLHHCPFREVAVTHAEVVCGAHLGLIQGALERSGGALAATRILPFVQPDLCLAELSRQKPQ